jgi:hypothetical protein
MSKTIKVSDETYEKIKDQIEEEKVKEKKEYKFEIKNRWTGNIIWSSNKTTFRGAVEEAVGRADLYGADLSEVDLRGADLYGADLSEVDLRGADLRGVDLRGANLYGADLSEVDLRGADLSEVDLSEVDLRGVDLRGANLYGADLSETKFYGRRGTTKIKKSQVDDFFKALGIIVED